LATVGASLDGLPAGGRAETLAQLQQRLRAAGWDVGKPVYRPAFDCIPDDPRCDPASIPPDITVEARRGDNILEIDINADNETPVMTFSMSRATPWTVYPAGVAGFIVGAAAGWILFGWASRRFEGRHWAVQALAKIFLGSGVFLWWAPTLLFTPLIVRYLLREPQFRWPLVWQWLGQPFLSLSFLFGCGAMGLALSLVILPREERADHTIAHD
jgi:hypothetical protein